MTVFALAILILYGRQQSPEENTIQSTPIFPAVGVVEDSTGLTGDSAEKDTSVGENSDSDQQDPNSDPQ